MEPAITLGIVSLLVVASAVLLVQGNLTMAKAWRIEEALRRVHYLSGAALIGAGWVAIFFAVTTTLMAAATAPTREIHEVFATAGHLLLLAMFVPSFMFVLALLQIIIYEWERRKAK